MENNLSNPMAYVGKIEKMYPDAYNRVYPHVHHLVDSLDDESMHNLTNSDIDQITENAMRRSNVINDPPVGHNPHTMRDMTRAFVARDLDDRFRRRRFFFPFFFFPFEERQRFRDFDRNRDFDRDRDRNMDHRF